jgi:hypothetical protein
VAQALYQFGQYRLKQNRTNYCSAVATDYSDLVSRYDGTPGAQMATAALAAPVKFTAIVLDLPKPQGVRVWLSKTVAPATRDYITSFSEEYTANLDATGTAVFQNVVPGKYNFSLLQRDGFHTYWRYTSPSFDPYTATVTSLCDASEAFNYSS